jgi:hypothetical protein
MDRPVVVNSLLCFIHNYRNYENLEAFVAKYFSEATQLAAKNILMELLSDLENGYSTPQLKESTTLLMMFDRVASSESCPVFAASDLASLPLVMIGNNPDGTQVFDEIQQIRFFIQNAMLAKETHKEIKKAR